jgi:sarcosine oxidase / L-pipecolate oxidase
MPQTYDFTIAGAGVMGISIAYYLSRKPKSVIVIDEPLQSAASRDLNKIVRRDYTDLFYMNKMGTSFSSWEDPLFDGFVHKSGRVVRCGESQLRSIKQNRKDIGLLDLEELSSQDAAQKLKDLIRCPVKEGTSTFFNAEDLWVELPQCLERMVRCAVNNGVVFQSDKVIELIIDQTNRHCEGVKTEQGAIVYARTVIIAAGAWAQKLLGDTLVLPGLRSLPVATGVIVAHFNLSDGEVESFESLPIFSDISGMSTPSYDSKSYGAYWI